MPAPTEYTFDTQGRLLVTGSSNTTLAVVCTSSELSALETKTKKTLRPPALQEAEKIYQSPLYLALRSFSEPLVKAFNQLNAYFVKNKIPFGFLQKLMRISDYHLHFIIDDNVSTLNNSDVSWKNAHPLLRSQFPLEPDSKLLSRWQEIENRLYHILDILEFIPTLSITLSFLNRSDAWILSRQTAVSDKQDKISFRADTIRQYIHSWFQTPPMGDKTPIYTKVSKALQVTKPTMVYLFANGAPTDNSPENFASLLIERSNPKNTPLTILNCTRQHMDWLLPIEREAPLISVINGYNTVNINREQGPTFPYNEAIHNVANLVSAIDPHGLGAVNKSCPLSKPALEEYLGRILHTCEYQSYLVHHPKYSKISQALRDNLEETKMPPDMIEALLKTPQVSFSSTNPPPELNLPPTTATGRIPYTPPPEGKKCSIM